MNYLQYVNTKQGSRSTIRYSHGNTLPLVQRPYGFLSFAPQTNGASSWYFHCDDKVCEGIRLTHQPSPWLRDHGSLSFLPQAIEPFIEFHRRYSGFNAKTSVIQPHYLRYDLNRSHSRIEVTPTVFGGYVRIHYDEACDWQKYLSVLPVSGFCSYRYDPDKNMLFCFTNSNFMSKDQYGINSYYVFKFDDDIIDVEKSLIDRDGAKENGISVEGGNTAIHLALKKNDISFKIGASYISHEQALVNLEREDKYESFEALKNENADLWNKYLSRIEIDADEETMKTFYSCMYRAFLYPHKAYEITKDGKAVHYAPTTGKVHDGYRYTDNGFWDTYRTVYPFLSIVSPEECAEIIEGFVQDYIDGGWLPRWSAGDAKNSMPSTAFDAVIADAAVKGIIGGELLKTAFEGMEKHANQKSENEAYGREGCEDYLNYGYVAYDDHNESVNLTLDAAYLDYCVATVAGILGYEDKKQAYLERAKNYKNLFDAETGFMRPRDKKGDFRPDFSPVAWGRDYTEAAAWQTTFDVQHDFEGLASLYGGKEKLIEKLDELFSAPQDYLIWGYDTEIHEITEFAAGDFGQCAINNQPSFHLPYIYAYFGQPEKTHYWVNKMCKEAFSYKEDGFPGDEDNGTMSLWYVFSSIGLYPLCPGKPEYTVHKPLVENIRILGKKIDLSGYNNIVSHSDIMKQING